MNLASIRRFRAPSAVLVTATLALALTACGTDVEDAAGNDDVDESFEPVTIEHAFGTTEITADPERVVTWGWGTADAVLALGEVPVGIPQQAYGGDENGVLPWIGEYLDENGLETPTVLPDDFKNLPRDEIIALDPDLFLAPYSGLTQKQYDDLTELGIDVVAYPDKPWTTPWRDVISITGEALGRTDEAAELIADLDDEVAARAEAHPEFAGRTIAAIADFNGLAVYKPIDPRVELLVGLGFTSAASVDELEPASSATAEDEPFYFMLSYEESDKLTSDVLLTYSDSADAGEAFLDSAPIRAMEQSKSGAIASVVGAAEVASVSPPTALSLTWGLDNLVDELAAATAQAD